MRQRDGTLAAAFLGVELAHEIAGGGFRQRLMQHEDADDSDQRLDQNVLRETESPQPPALIAGKARFRRDVVRHSRIKPCWSASNTASPRVWTSSLR
jgi:hypothetical protein